MTDERRCGSCTLCCKLSAVQELRKPTVTWCRHVIPGQGCGIYGDRPHSCQRFECVWFQHRDMPDSLRPDRCRVMFERAGPRTYGALVDPVTPLAWQAPIAQDFIGVLLGAGNSIIVSCPPLTPVVLTPPGRTAAHAWAEVRATMEAQARRIARATGQTPEDALREWVQISRGR